MQVKGSFWAEMSFLKIIFFWLIIPILIAWLRATTYVVTINEKTIKIKDGILRNDVREYAFAGATEINVYQSLFGRIFNYGTVKISLAGDKDVCLYGIKEPNEVKAFIEDKLLKIADLEHLLVN